MSATDPHAAFAAALLDPGLVVPDGVAGQPGASRSARFAVYRNNVVASLIDALAGRFPVTQRLVGEEFFRAMAAVFIRQSPPREPVLWHYGTALPGFIEGFEPAADLRWIADVTRLEIAWSEAWAAADAPALGPPDFAGLQPMALLPARATLHPALRLLRSQHPAGSLWAAHQGPDVPSAPAHWVPEDLLVTRPDAEVFVRVLPAGAFEGLSALAAGLTLEEALQASCAAAPDTDPATLLALAIETGALTALHLPEQA